MISSRFPSTKSSYQYSIRVYLGQLKKRLITIICVTETKRKFPSKKVWTSTTFEYLEQILIKAKRSQNRSKSFQRWVRNGEEKKKNAGTHGGREHWPVSLRSIHFCAPLHESYLRTASYFSNPNKSCFPIRVSQTESPMLHISIFFNNHSTYYLLDVLTKTDRRIRKKKKKRKRPRYHSERTGTIGKLINALDNPSTSNDLRHCTLYLAQLQLSSAHERCVTLPSTKTTMYRLLHSITSNPNLLNTYCDDNTESNRSNKTNNHQQPPITDSPRIHSIHSRRINPLSSPRYYRVTKCVRQPPVRWTNLYSRFASPLNILVSAACRWKLDRPNLRGVRACQGDRHDRVKTRRATVDSRYEYVAFEPWMRIILDAAGNASFNQHQLAGAA